MKKLKHIKRTDEACKICNCSIRGHGTIKVALTAVTDFNQVVTMDLKQMDGKKICI